jgi:hypothetical protein
MLTWNARDGFEDMFDETGLPASVKMTFHEDVLASTAFRKKQSVEDVVSSELPPLALKLISENQIWYDKLHTVATRLS